MPKNPQSLAMSEWHIRLGQYRMIREAKVYFNTLKTIDFIDFFNNVTIEWE